MKKRKGQLLKEALACIVGVITYATALNASAGIIYDRGTHDITTAPPQQMDESAIILKNDTTVNWNGADYAQENTDRIRMFALSGRANLNLNSGMFSITGKGTPKVNAHAMGIYTEPGYTGAITMNGGVYTLRNTGRGNGKFLRLNANGGADGYTVHLKNGTVNITKENKGIARLVRIGDNATVRISGGTYNLVESGGQMGVFQQLPDSRNSLLEVSGGTYRLDSRSEILLFRLERASGLLRISGGEFIANQNMTGLVRGGRVVLEGTFNVEAGVYDKSSWTDGPIHGVLSDGSTFSLGMLSIATDRMAGNGIIEIVSPTKEGRILGGVKNYFAENGQGGPLNILQHPSLHFFNGKTYIAYQGLSEDAYVAVYDHASDQWNGPVLAGTSFLKDGDGHGKPTICVDDDGYIHVVFGGHGGHSSFGDNTAHSHEPPGRTLANAGKQIHMRSDEPEDISSWSELDNITPFGTYSQLIKMDNGDLYLFYRHGGHKADWVYQRSIDNGRTFESEVIVMDAVEFGAREGVEAWYMWFGKGPNDSIITTYTHHPCRYENHIDRRYNTYYMQMDCTDHSWRNVSGKVLAMPLTKKDADANTLVKDSGDMRVNVGVVRTNPSGNPWILYPEGDDSILLLTQWTGDQWTDSVTVAPLLKSQHGDLLFQSETGANILISAKDGDTGMYGVSWFTTKDVGASWHWMSDVFPYDDSSWMARLSSFIDNGHPDARILMGEMRSAGQKLDRIGTRTKVYLYGDSGFVKREGPSL